MRSWIWSAFGFSVACATVSFGTEKQVRIGAFTKVVEWQTSETVVSAPKLGYGEIVAVPKLDSVTLPAGYFFVPICCSVTPWRQQIQIVDDDGRPDGTMSASGITRVLLPFPKDAGAQQFLYVHVDPNIVGGFGDEHTDPALPWVVSSIYLLGIPDIPEGRRAMDAAKSLEDVFRCSELIIEVHSERSLRSDK